MIAFSYITDSLNELDKLYNKATSRKKAIYYSKLATLELCGWVEDTVDDIVLRHANRKLKITSNKKYIRKDVVKRNSGFQYDDKSKLVVSKYQLYLPDIEQLKNKVKEIIEK
ncbi:MAG: hypothetical protein GY749_31775 [Desulfobacteraceae bacterium]|nr:hypothetical protein [Desulfobacteraceae bacterium]